MSTAGILAMLGLVLLVPFARSPITEVTATANSGLLNVQGHSSPALASSNDPVELTPRVTGSVDAIDVQDETFASARDAQPARRAFSDFTPASRPDEQGQSAPEGKWFTIGSSVQGRPIQALRLGSGPVGLALMGSIHGGWERNTERLVRTAYEHFRDQPEQIPKRVSLYFVPTTNPDGLVAGSDRDSAWNARGVDLNRNFDTPNWSPDTYGRVGGRYGPTGTRRGAGGTAPFSEPETRAIRDFVVGHSISAVMSYHSGIVSVSAKDGGGGIAEPLARRVAQITGYPYIASWTEYRLTGQFMDWLDIMGLKGVEIDLPNQQSIDWPQNLAAVEAVIAALASD